MKSDDMLNRIVAKYGDGILKLSAMRIRRGAGVFDKVLGTGEFKRVLEIGTLFGVSAACMSPYVEKVTTIDLVHGRKEQLGANFDRQELWDAMGVKNVELHLVADDSQKASLVRGLDFDIAFIDGGKYNIAADFALVKRCGAVLFHDVDSRGSPHLDVVYDFVMALPRDQVTRHDIFALWRRP